MVPTFFFEEDFTLRCLAPVSALSSESPLTSPPAGGIVPGIFMFLTDSTIELTFGIFKSPFMTFAVPEGGVGGASSNWHSVPMKQIVEIILRSPKYDGISSLLETRRVPKIKAHPMPN